MGIKEGWIRSDERHFICTSIPFLIMHPRKIKKNIPLTHWKPFSRAKSGREKDTTNWSFFLFFFFHYIFISPSWAIPCHRDKERREKKVAFDGLSGTFILDPYEKNKFYFVCKEKPRIFISVDIFRCLFSFWIELCL